MSGFGHTIEEAGSAVAVAPVNTNAEFKRFEATLPDIPQVRAALFALEFYALCPNGKRIPVQSICEEYTKDPKGLVYRSFDNRLVLILQAVFPGKEIPYWQQAFYLSTGQSSEMKNTWLPMNGIMLNDEYSYYTESSGGKKELELWYSKDEFAARKNAKGIFPPSNLKMKKLYAFDDIYNNGILLPEGDLLFRGSHFDRFGTLSYLLASHAIGGQLFEYGEVEYFAENIHNAAIEAALLERISVPSPLQPCFLEIASTYPISKIPDVNTYIDQHKATSIMNAFREYNLFPPGLADLSPLVPSLGYAVPVRSAWAHLKSEVNTLFRNLKLETITIEDVRAALSDRATLLEKIRESLPYFGKEPRVTFNISKNHKEFYKNYLGGKRKSRRRQGKKKRTRKSRN